MMTWRQPTQKRQRTGYTSGHLAITLSAYPERTGALPGGLQWLEKVPLDQPARELRRAGEQMMKLTGGLLLTRLCKEGVGIPASRRHK